MYVCKSNQGTWAMTNYWLALSFSVEDTLADQGILSPHHLLHGTVQTFREHVSYICIHESRSICVEEINLTSPTDRVDDGVKVKQSLTQSISLQREGLDVMNGQVGNTRQGFITCKWSWFVNVIGVLFSISHRKHTRYLGSRVTMYRMYACTIGLYLKAEPWILTRHVS